MTLNDIPFMRELGIQVLDMAGGESRLVLDLEERHMNGWQVAHGGVIMTMLDIAMAVAGRSLVPDARAGVTVEMKTSFVQPGGKPGARLTARGRAFHNTVSMSFCEGEVWDGDRLVAKAMGTFKFLRRVDAGRKLEHG
ncbi:MAG: PaaI family thioesterase [Noviherbaspirillum sp.]